MKKGDLKQYMHIFHTLSFLLQKKFELFRKDFSRTKYLKFTASFLSLLVLTLPFYTANVYASTIFTIKTEDDFGNQKRFVKETDYIVYKATVFIDEDGNDLSDEDVDYNQVWLEQPPPAIPFSACSLNNIGRYECRYRFPSTGTTLFSSYDYTVSLYTDTTPRNNVPGNNLDTLSGRVELENIPPEVNSFSILEDKTSGDVTFVYSIQDYANDRDDLNTCSGIDKIDFYDSSSGTVLKTETINTNDCRYPSSGTAQTTAFLAGSGTINICARAYDKAGLSLSNPGSDDCDTVEVDRTAPTADPSLFKIFYRDTTDEIEYAPLNKNIDATIEVVIIGSDLNKDTVNASLDVLNSDSGTYTDHELLSCSGTDTITCTKDFILKLSSSGSKQVIVRFSDDAGNDDSRTFTHNFIEDTTAPIVSSIETNYLVDGDYYAAKYTNFTVTFVESGSGMNPEDIKFYISGILMAPPTECILNACVWEDIEVSETFNGIASIGTDTKDRAGNFVANEFVEEDIQLDLIKPIIKDVVQETEFPSAVEGLEFTVYVKEDETEPEVYADFLLITTYGDIQRGSCDETGITKCQEPAYTQGTCWECPISVSFLTYDRKTVSIEFFAEDSVGGIDSFTLSGVEVFEAEGAQPDNLIFPIVEATTPRKVDRHVASITNLPLFIPVNLVPSADHTVTLADADITIMDKVIVRGSCSALGGALQDVDSTTIEEMIADPSKITDESFISLDKDFLTGTPYLFDKDSDTPQIVIAIRGSPEDLLQAKAIKVNCTLSLSIKKGDVIYLQPEREKIVAYTSLFDTPGGTIPDSLQSRIDDIKESIRSMESEIQYKVDSSTFLRSLCSIAQPLAVIDAITQSILTSVTGTACMLSLIPGVQLAWSTGVCTPLDTFHKFVVDFIWDPGLVPTGVGVGYVIKLSCTVYSCRLADASFWTGILGAFAGGFVASQFETGDVYITEKVELFIDLEGSGEVTVPAAEIDWGEVRKRTELNLPIPPEVPFYDVYRSIHHARGFACWPGIIYNLRKHRQIRCLQIKCIEDNAAAGISTAACDDAYAERKCLYFDGAISKLLPDLNGFFGHLWDYWWESFKDDWLNSVLGVAGVICIPWQAAPTLECAQPACSSAGAIRNCGIVATVQAIIDVLDFMDSPISFEDFEAELSGSDFCADVDLS